MPEQRPPGLPELSGTLDRGVPTERQLGQCRAVARRQARDRAPPDLQGSQGQVCPPSAPAIGDGDGDLLPPQRAPTRWYRTLRQGSGCGRPVHHRGDLRHRGYRRIILRADTYRVQQRRPRGCSPLQPGTKENGQPGIVLRPPSQRQVV